MGCGPAQLLALHLHDTHGTALANCLAAMELGIATFDTSIGGMGGCPYAPGAAGNLATEDLASMLADMGIETGIDLEKIQVLAGDPSYAAYNVKATGHVAKLRRDLGL